MPYINRPYRNRPKYLDYLSRYIDPPEDSPPQTDFTVDLAPFPSHFLPNGRAVFTPSKRKDYIRMKDRDFRPDLVIYATGYTQNFDFLDKASGYPTPEEANVRNIVREGDESVAFIGFVRPGVGAYFIILVQQYGMLICAFRCHPAYSRDAIFVLDFARERSSPSTVTAPSLSPSREGDCAYQIRSRPFHLYEYPGKGHRRCSRSLGTLERIWDSCARMLLVSTQ